jgi:hypothetical protein
MEKSLGTCTHHIHDVFRQYLFHNIHRVVCRVPVVSKSIHQIAHWEQSQNLLRFAISEALTFFRKQSFEVRLSLRSCGEAPGSRVSASTGGIYRVCIARGCVCGRETSPPGGTARGGVVCGRSPGKTRCRCCHPMLGRHVGVVGPCCAVSSDRSGRIGVRRVRPGCLGVCCWSVSVGVGARLTWVVVGHGARLASLGTRHTIGLRVWLNGDKKRGLYKIGPINRWSSWSTNV